MSCKQLKVPKLFACENVVNVLVAGVRKLLFLSGTELKYFISRKRKFYSVQVAPSNVLKPTVSSS